MLGQTAFSIVSYHSRRLFPAAAVRNCASSTLKRLNFAVHRRHTSYNACPSSWSHYESHFFCSISFLFIFVFIDFIGVSLVVYVVSVVVNNVGRCAIEVMGKLLAIISIFVVVHVVIALIVVNVIVVEVSFADFCVVATITIVYFAVWMRFRNDIFIISIIAVVVVVI